MSRRQRQIDQLGALCHSGHVARAVDLAFEHFATFGRDERVVDLLTHAVDHHPVGDAIRQRLADLSSGRPGPDRRRVVRRARRYRRTMRISLLGELEVFDDDGRAVVITGAKQRALLAMLALHPGQMVPADQLVEGLWGEHPPPAVRNGLQGLVSKLRRALGSPGLLVMRGGGYVLDVAPDAVDVHRFEQLVAQGRAAAADGDLARAVALLGEADALWRGEALAEFAYEDFASGATARWSELRLAAIEERLDAELELGHPGVVAELESLVAAHPLRERLRGLLMLALYRSRRQAEALRVARDGRRILSEELGLDPDPELQRLEAAILAQDPSLAAPAPCRGRRHRRHQRGSASPCR